MQWPDPDVQIVDKPINWEQWAERMEYALRETQTVLLKIQKGKSVELLSYSQHKRNQALLDKFCEDT